jgi:hypothetical protein
MSRRKIRGNRSEAMKEEKCPFLEVTKVTFCKAFPVKKMIPLDRSSSAKGVCTTDSFRQCPAFREINAHNSEAEHIRGFHLKAAYYFHPKHLWISPSEAGEGEVRVGIDDFSQKIIGPIDNLTLPPEGSMVKENNVCILLHSGWSPPATGSSSRSTGKSPRTRKSSTGIRTTRDGSSRCTWRGKDFGGSFTEE